MSKLNIDSKLNPFFFMLVGLWFSSSALKVFFNSNVYINSPENYESILNSLFWISGFIIVILRFFLVKFTIDSNLKLVLATIVCSLINLNILAFSFSLLIWNAIATVIKPKQFIILYSVILLCLIFSFMASVSFYGQTYFNDPRYGNVETFGFMNSNSFPQLLIIFFLISAMTPKISVPLAVILYFSFKGSVETRTFYFLLVLYPLTQMCFSIIRAKIISSIPIVLFLFCIFLGMIYPYAKTPLILLIDSMLSYRISFGSIMLSALSPSEFLFGASRNTFESLTIPMDMSYISVVFKYGLLSSIILMCLYTKAIKKMYVDKSFQVMTLVIAFLMYALVENVLISYYLNPTLYFLFYFCSIKKIQI